MREDGLRIITERRQTNLLDIQYHPRNATQDELVRAGQMILRGESLSAISRALGRRPGSPWLIKLRRVVYADMNRRGQPLPVCQCGRRAAHPGVCEARWNGGPPPNAKVPDSALETIRAQYAEGGVSQYELARQWGVKQVAISQIVRGKRRAQRHA